MQFIHESVRQHILNGGLAILRPSLSRNVEAASHAILATWCQDYVRNGSWEHMNPNTSEDLLRQAFPLIEYVSFSTFYHMEDAHSQGALEITELRNFPLKHWIDFRRVTQGTPYVNPTVSFLYLCLEELEALDDPSIPKALLTMHPRHSIFATNPINDIAIVDQDSSVMLFGTSLNSFCGGIYGYPLVAAALSGSKVLAGLLLECGADVNVCSDDFVSSSVRAKQARQYVVDPSTGICEHPITTHYSSPLAAAAAIWTFEHVNERLRLPLVRLLLDHGANVNARNGSFGTALGSAIQHCYGEIARVLLDHGADINLEDSGGVNIALHHAMRPSETCLALYNRERITKMLFDRGVRARPTALNTFLLMAVQYRQVRTIKMLVHAGADPNCRDIHARTALHALAESRVAPRFVETAALLLDLGIDVNANGGEHDTALIAASARGNEELVKFLLDNGADVRHRSGKHGTAIDVARAAATSRRDEDYDKIVQMLSEADLK